MVLAAFVTAEEDRYLDLEVRSLDRGLAVFCRARAAALSELRRVQVLAQDNFNGYLRCLQSTTYLLVRTSSVCPPAKATEILPYHTGIR